MKKAARFLSICIVACMLLNTAIFAADTGEQLAGSVSVDTADQLYEPAPSSGTPEVGSYNEGVVLVKSEEALTADAFAELDVVSVEPLYRGSAWYTVTLGETVTTAEAVTYLKDLDCFDAVDYDYIMKADGEVQSVDISGNTYAENLTYLDTLGVKKGWESNLQNGKTPGGSPDVVIAVIDTGVDYNHLDLRNNIWTNPAEIPDNGIDDDGNGYIDDIHGWDCVGDDNDPMDDNGHGTHVAGIAAAENNKLGTVGVAYNCKIMVLKAGNSSGYFNSSDIAEAVQYAYMNGASVINMSFGGASISFAVEEALKDAYNQCVLVAAAGNDGKCNQPGCQAHIMQPPTPFYPASLTYVIGVMSCDASGTYVSAFSNFDHVSFNKYEYEVYACGEAIQSTWPNNKYAVLSGTSMAAPTISGIAAVLRSTYTDREMYSNKYIQSQIVNTGTKMIMAHTVANLYESLTKTPTPSVNLYDYYVFDSVEFSNKNNGDGIIDAGETIHLAVELQNRGGVASNVVATVDTIRNNDPDLADPYFDITTSTITLSDIGTYSVRGSQLIYTAGVVTGSKEYFEILVSEDCPNDYLCTFNINISYTNGLDVEDTNQYIASNAFNLTVTNGVVLAHYYATDTILPGNRRYIVDHNVTIADGASLTFEAGATIQFYTNRAGYYDTIYSTPAINGKIIFNGTKENVVNVHTSEFFGNYFGNIFATSDSQFIYTNFINTSIVGGNLLNCTVGYNTTDMGTFYELKNGAVDSHPVSSISLVNVNIKESIIDASNVFIFTNFAVDCFESSVLIFPATLYNSRYINDASDSLFVSHESKVEEAENSYSTGNVDNIVIYKATNNVFLNETSSNRIKDYTLLTFVDYKECIGNRFYGMYKTHPEWLLVDVFDAEGKLKIDVNDSTGQDISKVYPHISNIHLENTDGETITTCGTELVRYVVDFNRDMDTTMDISLFFGTIEPYADYEIKGEWVSSRKWVGEYAIKAIIENGIQRFRIKDARTADAEIKCYNNAAMYIFDLDTTAAMSMNLQANPTERGIDLTWFQDDYDTLLGYNIYRADSKDGNYVKINPAILLPEDETFLDDNAEPGKTYWYTYTVVLTDFSESNPAGRVIATALDTLAPNVYHTPVNQGYMNNNLVISCTASDNVAISNVTLYYRAVGADQWKSLSMLKQSDKYSATVFGSELSLDGLEYYIVASDGRNTIAKGSADTPYTVVIKDASAISRAGDVDGDGVVTTKDALMLMQHITGDLILTDDEFKRADLSGNGNLESFEALRILQYINGNINTLVM